MYTQGETRDYALKARPGAVVSIKTPTERQRRKLMPRERPTEQDLTGFFDWCALIVSAQVVAVTGYENRGVKISTGADLAEYGDDATLIEVATEIYNEISLTEEARKNSDAPSDTQQPEGSTVPVAAPGA